MSLRDEHYEIFPEDREENLNNYDPFSRPFIDHYCSENEAKIYLTREDILELGFLRSNPERKIYQHSNNPNLYLERVYSKDYSIKDFGIETIQIYIKTSFVNSVKQILYTSTKPNKEDIQQIINNYAG